MAKKQSDFSRAFSEDGALKTHVGGQALLEGIMMRGKYNWAVAVREPDGNVYTEMHDLASGKSGNGWMHWPLVRGCRALVESLMLGFKALEIATMHAFDDEDGPKEQRAEAEAGYIEEKAAAEAQEAIIEDCYGLASGAVVETKPLAVAVQGGDIRDSIQAAVDGEAAEGAGDASSKAAAAESRPEAEDEDTVEFGHTQMVASMVIGVVLGIVLFIVAPAFITNLIVGEYDSHTVVWNIVDGLLRVAVFVFYLWLIGRMDDIKRMFMYHGAEHKTIHCYEHGLELTPENARSFPRLHVRCGTAFLIMVMIIAIFIYTIFPVNAIISGLGVPDGLPKLALVIAVRIVLMPVIAGISYEITVKWAGSHPENPLVKLILWPGMQMQYLTTHEPDDGQLECAIAAMRLVLERERAEEKAAAEA